MCVSVCVLHTHTRIMTHRCVLSKYRQLLFYGAQRGAGGNGGVLTGSSNL